MILILKLLIVTLSIEAKDPGDLAAHCSVQVEILDENDCAPEVIVDFSIYSPTRDSPPGTLIALIKTKDRDSGENGEVDCQILGKAEFILKSYLKNYYKLTTDRTFDREEISEYNITVMATDRGKPPLSLHNHHPAHRRCQRQRSGFSPGLLRGPRARKQPSWSFHRAC